MENQNRAGLARRSRAGENWPGPGGSASFNEFTEEETAQTVAARFEQQAAIHGYRTAILCRGEEVTYRELNATANAIARRILAQRRGSTKPIVLLLEQDANEIAAVLGCFKAGGICVPLSRDCDPERVRQIVADTESSLIISDGRNLPRGLAAARGSAIINLDEFDPAGGADNLQRSISPDALAYILYTSGSTGLPKGIVQSHRNLLHDLRAYTNCFQITLQDRLTLFAPCSGAQGMKTSLSAVVNGAALCLWDVKTQGLAALADWLVEEEISIFISAPTIFRSFTDVAGGAREFPKIRLIKLGSEALLREDVERYKRYFSGNCQLVNWYSSTETGNVSYRFIDKTSEVSHEVVALGFPHADKKVFVRDPSGRSLGVDEIGEIAVKSRYLPLGYWRRADLTAAKYLNDPNGGAERICLTGDLGVMRSDGSLEYRGRKDARVKVRGFSVEVNDIEAALRRHPGVSEAAVEAFSDGPNQKLVAYLVCAGSTAPNTSEMRRYLRLSLFEHMVPSDFVFLDSLPLTANGKVDRRALPRPGDGRPNLESSYVAPANHLQRELALIWQKVLAIHPIGVRDNFFDLGGHSLLAVRLVSEIGKTFKKSLVPSLLFQAPTIEQFAEILGTEGQSWSSLMPIQPAGSKRPFFWIHGDSSAAYLSRYLGSDQPFYSLEHQSQDGKAARYTYVESIAAKYFREIRTVQAHGPYYLGGYSFGGLVALEVAQQLIEQDDEVALLVLLDPPEPLIGIATANAPTGVLSEGVTALESFRDRWRRYSGKFGRLACRDKFAYLRRRIVSTVDQMSSRLSKRLKRALAAACVILGRELPASVRSQYILGIYHRARLRYRMRSYPGRVVLFKGDGRSHDYMNQWEHYLVGEKFFYEVPGNHLELRQGPYIRNWAEPLKASLEAAQAAVAGVDDGER